MAFGPLEVPDCQMIARTFELAANYCATEESVFAMMTPMLSNIRANSSAFVTQWDANEALLTGTPPPEAKSKGTTSDEALSRNMMSLANSADTDAAMAENVKDGKWGGVWDEAKQKWKECFPCEFNIDHPMDLVKQLWETLAKTFMDYWNWFQQMLQQLLDMLDFFNRDNYAFDLCALWEFFHTYVCVPDLRKLLSSFMALLQRMGMELNNLFDMILSIVAPLFMPFLSSILNTLEQYLMAIVKPLECIINNVLSMMGKIDYAPLFKDQDVKIDVGPQGRYKDRQLGGMGLDFKSNVNPVPIPFTDGKEVPPPPSTPDVPKKESGQLTSFFGLQTANWGASFETSPVQGIKRDEQRAVEQAEEELAKVRAEGGNVDMANTKEREAYMDRLQDAREKRREAMEEKNNTELQEAQTFLREKTKIIKSFLFKLVEYVRQAIQTLEAFVRNLYDEFRKLMQGFLGGNGKTILKLFEKLELLKMIDVIIAIFDWLKNPKCDDEEEDKDIYTSLLNKNTDRDVWTDENGTVHIDERPNVLANAIDVVLEAEGVSPVNPEKRGVEVIGRDQVGGSTQIDQSRQRVKSLIELTGDPTLDTTIARAVDAATTPAKIRFKCPLQTSVADAEKINKWIRELNAE